MTNDEELHYTFTEAGYYHIVLKSENSFKKVIEVEVPSCGDIKHTLVFTVNLDAESYPGEVVWAASIYPKNDTFAYSKYRDHGR
jgi:hypothetical protein